MNKLLVENGKYLVNKRRKYNPLGVFPNNILNKCFNFAYEMTLGNGGEHRDNRSGGSNHRKKGEIFINVFQGKLAEYGIWNEFAKRKIEIDSPDLNEYGLGKWDDFDLEVKGAKIAVKSTKSKGNLLLLEQKDWNEQGEYIPNIYKGTGHNDFFVLLRIYPDGEKIMKEKKFLYSNNITKGDSKKVILDKNLKWSYDIAGFITHTDLCEAIKDKNIIKKGDILNKYTIIDADNYYVQAGDMKTIDELFKII
ncbi:hypothetical protein [Clostridium botulinum]|uniref:hypothetical protein n=1 Tax=Clostridium botulinum TaxID=1491 RepID=UPI0007740704|nr:hypothetical protein [Clostridium botulinum]